MVVTAVEQEVIIAHEDSEDAYLSEWWELCERDIMHLKDASRQRSLTKDEVNSAQTLIEIMAQLDARKKNRGWWYRAQRRAELARKYLKA